MVFNVEIFSLGQIGIMDIFLKANKLKIASKVVLNVDYQPHSYLEDWKDSQQADSINSIIYLLLKSKYVRVSA